MRIKKQKSKCQPTKKRKFSQLPSKTSLEVCEQLVKDTLQREGGLLLVLNDIESFAKCGKSGILCKLLKLSQNATMQVGLHIKFQGVSWHTVSSVHRKV